MQLILLLLAHPKKYRWLVHGSMPYRPERKWKIFVFLFQQVIISLSNFLLNICIELESQWRVSRSDLTVNVYNEKAIYSNHYYTLYGNLEDDFYNYADIGTFQQYRPKYYV